MENGAEVAPSRELEDALMYLPRKALTSYRKGQIIFDEHHPPNGIHLVVQGRVKVTIRFEDGTETIIDIFSTRRFPWREFPGRQPSAFRARHGAG